MGDLFYEAYGIELEGSREDYLDYDEMDAIDEEDIAYYRHYSDNNF